MTIDEFWKLLEALPKGENAEDELRERLNSLTPLEIFEFQTHFDSAHTRAYNGMLWAAAYVIDGGCSDDGFIEFRYGLISRGRQVFEAALADPDTLADLANEEDDEGCIANEAFGYVASEVYEEKTGSELPRGATSAPIDPVGEDWDFDDDDLCAQKLPKLWAKFCD